MKIDDISRIRLNNQGLLADKFKSPLDCLNHMGALQAQDFSMAKWALGIRVKDSTESKINNALDKGEIIRTHLLRPTWHFVSPKNVYWMLELTAPHIRMMMRSRDKQLGLTESIFRKSNRTIEKVLEKKDNATREELVAALNRAKIQTNENRSSHLLMYAELNSLICSGRSEGIKNTYALLEKRIPKPKQIDRDEAMQKLGKIYFKSHGPATLKDFTWWSGLSIKDAKRTLEMIRKDLQEIKIGDEIYLMSDSSPASKANTIHLLPAFDEMIISYKDRKSIIAHEHHSKAISSNGIFNPTIVLNGQVLGLWKRLVQKEKVTIKPEFFIAPNEKIKALVKKAAKEYAVFLNKKPEIEF